MSDCKTPSSRENDVRQVSIVNVYGDDNRGSAALNMAAVRLIRRVYPRATIGLIAINEFEDSLLERRYRHTTEAHPDAIMLPPLLHAQSVKYGAWSSIPLEITSNSRLFRRFSSASTSAFLEESDLVVSRGGVVYRSCRTVGDTASFLRRTTALRRAQALGIPTVFLGLHAQTDVNAYATRLFHKQFQQSSLILPRGPYSLQAVQSLSNQPNIRTLPDSVFGADLVERPVSRPQRASIIVSVSEPYRPVFPLIVDLIRELFRSGHIEDVIIVVQVSGDDSDHIACRDLRSQLPVSSELIADDLSPEQLVSLYSTATAVVTTRLHMAIFGLLAGRPSFPIALSGNAKAHDVFKEIGLGRMVLDSKDSARWHKLVTTSIELRAGEVGGAVQAAVERYSEFPALLHHIGSS